MFGSWVKYDENIVDKVYQKLKNLSLHDIRLMDKFDDYMLEEHAEIENLLCRRLILKKVKKFEEDKDEFKVWLQYIHMEDYWYVFSINGILTLESLRHNLKSVEDLKKMIGEKNVQFIWNSVPQLVE